MMRLFDRAVALNITTLETSERRPKQKGGDRECVNQDQGTGFQTQKYALVAAAIADVLLRSVASSPQMRKRNV